MGGVVVCSQRWASFSHSSSSPHPCKCCLLGNWVHSNPLWPSLQGHRRSSYCLESDPMSLSWIAHLPNNSGLTGFSVASSSSTQEKTLSYHLKHLGDEGEGRDNLTVSGWLLTHFPLIYHISHSIWSYSALAELMLHWFWFMCPNGHLFWSSGWERK